MIKSQRTSKYLHWTAASLLSVTAAQAYELKFGTNLPPVDVHGFASQGFLYSSDYNYLGDTEDGTGQFTEIGLNLTFSPFDRTRIAVQGFAFDVGDVGNLMPFLDYASIEYRFNDEIGLRGGRVRRPGGIYNHIQDVDLARTSVLLPQGIYDSRWRDFNMSIDGGEVFGNISLGKGGSFSYEGFGGMAHLSKEGGIARLLQKTYHETGGTLDSLDSFLTTGVQLWWNTPVDGLRVGALFAESLDFGFHATQPLPVGAMAMDSTTDAFAQQYSIEYLWNNWTFQSEYYRSDQTTDMSQRSQLLGNSTTSSDRTEQAWYFGAAYRFNKWFEAGSYYTEYYVSPVTSGVNSDESQKDLALSLRFDPKDWWVLKLEGHFIRGTALLQDNEANPNRNNDGWFMLAAKTTFSF
jgi:hypothetical protein